MPAAAPSLVFDWNRSPAPAAPAAPFELLDETLRDGLQSPSVRDPALAAKRDLLERISALGVQAVDIGLPAASPRAAAHALALARHIAARRLPLRPVCAARTHVGDVQAIAELVQRSGLAVEAYTFIGCSPIRMDVEGWRLDDLRRHVAAALAAAVAAGLACCMVLEDATRADPAVLGVLVRDAVRLGATRVCLCDTVGHATPRGVANLLAWAGAEAAAAGGALALDWHGHNDRGLALANSLEALAHGAHRIHGTALGIGERVGNAALDQIMVNLRLAGQWPRPLTALAAWCAAAAVACGTTVPPNYPVFGADAFRTGSGVHAAAIAKAQRRGDTALADRVYSAVPAADFGRHQRIEVGPHSGASNVVHWLQARGLEASPGRVAYLLAAAKGSGQVLADAQLRALVRAHDADGAPRRARAAGGAALGPRRVVGV